MRKYYGKKNQEMGRTDEKGDVRNWGFKRKGQGKTRTSGMRKNQ